MLDTTQPQEPSAEIVKEPALLKSTNSGTRSPKKLWRQLLQRIRHATPKDATPQDTDSRTQQPQLAVADGRDEKRVVDAANELSSVAQRKGQTTSPKQDTLSTAEKFDSSGPGIFRRGRRRNDEPQTSTSERKETVGANIVVFGETGVGKSSVINLIAGAQRARTSNAALGCTFGHDSHPIQLEETSFILWDTAGLDEGSEGTVPAEEAEKNLRVLLGGLSRSGGIHLVIYCIRGARLTKTLKHNYDLFYATICRRKVPVALVVTGLEHQIGGMETWWTQNVGELQRNGMRFDDHACVTSLGEDIQDEGIQTRRKESQARLRKLIQSYSKLPGWKVEESWFSKVSPLLRRLFRRITSKDLEASAQARKVVVCGSFTGIFADTTLVWDKGSFKIGNTVYDFLRVDKNSLLKITPEEFEGAGLIVFHASALTENRLEATDVTVLKKLHDLAGGQGCPVIVILKDCNDKGVAWDCRQQITSTHRDIRPNVVISSEAEGKMTQTVELFYLEPIESKAQTVPVGEKTPRKGKN